MLKSEEKVDLKSICVRNKNKNCKETKMEDIEIK